MTEVTEERLIELGFKLDGNKWVHEKGTFIYLNKVPSTLKELVDIMTGTAYKKAKSNCI